MRANKQVIVWAEQARQQQGEKQRAFPLDVPKISCGSASPWISMQINCMQEPCSFLQTGNAGQPTHRQTSTMGPSSHEKQQVSRNMKTSDGLQIRSSRCPVRSSSQALCKTESAAKTMHWSSLPETITLFPSWLSRQKVGATDTPSPPIGNRNCR